MTYEVQLIRTSTRLATIKLESENAFEARRKALEIAGDIDFPPEKDAQYEIELISEV